MPSRFVVTAVLLLLGCNHTEPFFNPGTGTDSPFEPTPPVQLTLNQGADRAPIWLPDGSGILYSAQQLNRTDRDQCLALLPPTGGRQRGLWCDHPSGLGWTDAFLSPTPAADGRLAFLGGSSKGVHPEVLDVRVAPVADPLASTGIRKVPFPDFLTQIRWLDASRIIYIAQEVRYRVPCSQCPLDTVLANLDLKLLDVAAPGATPTPVPGTELATGVAPLEGGTEILYTLALDSRVYRRNLATGEVTVVHDFGTAGIARDLHVVGSRLAVVVGGIIVPEQDIELGRLVQWDSGGAIHVLDLSTGDDAVLEDPTRLYRRPALSPSRNQVVAEGYAAVISRTTDPLSGQEIVDTAVSGLSDLYLIGIP